MGVREGREGVALDLRLRRLWVRNEGEGRRILWPGGWLLGRALKGVKLRCC